MAILEKTAPHRCAIMVVAAGTEVLALLLEKMPVRARVRVLTKGHFVSLVSILTANSPRDLMMKVCFAFPMSVCKVVLSVMELGLVLMIMVPGPVHAVELL